jgi:hypothetical protein
MPIKKDAVRYLALIVAAVFLFQNCMTIIRGTSQKIPVTSNPMGARITVDGKDMGTTPLRIKLKRNRSHSIRAEMPGFNPLEIGIIHKLSGSSLALSVLGNYLFLGSLAAALLGGGKIFGAMILAIFNQEEAQKEMDKASTAMGLGALLGITIGLLADFTSGANSKLSPTELDVTLTRTDGNPQPDKVFMDSGEFQNIKWIRIRLSPRETEVLSLDCVD